MALGRGERDRSGLVGVVSAEPGLAGGLEIIDQVVGWSERSGPGYMAFGTGLVECAERLDAFELPVGRCVRNQPDRMGADTITLWPRCFPCSSPLTRSSRVGQASKYASRWAAMSNLTKVAHYYGSYKSWYWVLHFLLAFHIIYTPTKAERLQHGSSS